MQRKATALIDLTLSPSDAVSRPGARYDVRPTIVEFEHFTPTGMQRISNVRLSPHGLTHIDLPASVDSSFDGEVFGAARSERCPAVILNLLDRRRKIEEEFDDLWPISFRNLHAVLHRIRSRKEDIIEILEIGERDLSRLADEVGGLAGKLLVLHTGWEHFVPRDRDLCHPYLNGIHPFFLFPHFTEAGMRSLIDSHCVLGVGTDATSFEFAKWVWSSNPLTSNCRDLVPDELEETSYGPLHRHFLDNGRVILENLSISPRVYAPRPADPFFADLVDLKKGRGIPHCVTGEVLVVPFPMKSSEATVVKVYFTPECWLKEDS